MPKEKWLHVKHRPSLLLWAEAYAMNRISFIKSKTKHCGGHVSLVVNVVLLIDSCDSLS